MSIYNEFIEYKKNLRITHTELDNFKTEFDNITPEINDYWTGLASTSFANSLSDLSQEIGTLLNCIENLEVVINHNVEVFKCVREDYEHLLDKSKQAFIESNGLIEKAEAGLDVLSGFFDDITNSKKNAIYIPGEFYAEYKIY